MPERIQLRRTKGWRRPPGVVVVARPSKWGNPYRIGDPHPLTGIPMDAAAAVELYRGWLELPGTSGLARREEARADLAGRDLACWCPLDGRPCHADVLLDVANGH